MSDLITPHDFVDDCDCHQCSLRARDQLRTEVDRLRNIEAAAVVCNDFPEWSGEAFYDSLLDLGKALRGEVGAGGTATEGHNDRVEGRDAASSRRVPSHDGLGLVAQGGTDASS